MVEFYSNDNASNTHQLKGVDSQHLFSSAMDLGHGSLKEMAEAGANVFKNSGAIEGANLSNSDIQKALSEKHLPKLDIIGMKGFPRDILNPENPSVEKAANIIDETNTLGTDDQKQRLTKMFEDEYKKAADKVSDGDYAARREAGEAAVRQLVDDINESLERRGSESRVSLDPPLVKIEPYGTGIRPPKVGDIVVNRGDEKTDHITVREPDQGYVYRQSFTMNQGNLHQNEVSTKQ